MCLRTTRLLVEWPPQSGRNIGYLGKNSTRITYREGEGEGHFTLCVKIIMKWGCHLEYSEWRRQEGRLTYSIMLLPSHFLRVNFQWSPSLGEKTAEGHGGWTTPQTNTLRHTKPPINKGEICPESPLSLAEEGGGCQGLSGLTEVKLWPDTLKSRPHAFVRLLVVISCCETKQN